MDSNTEGTWQNQNSNHFESVMEMPLIPVPGSQRQRDYLWVQDQAGLYSASHGYILRPCLKKIK